MRVFVSFILFMVIALTSSASQVQASQSFFNEPETTGFSVPRPVFLEIIQYLDPGSFRAALRVNHTWRSAILNDPSMWLAEEIDDQVASPAVLLRQASHRRGGLCALMANFRIFSSDLRGAYPFRFMRKNYQPTSSENHVIFDKDARAWEQLVRSELIMLQDKLDEQKRSQLFAQLGANPGQQLSDDEKNLLLTDICHSKLLMAHDPQIATACILEIPFVAFPLHKGDGDPTGALLCRYGSMLLETNDARGSFISSVCLAASNAPELAEKFSSAVSRMGERLLQQEDEDLIKNNIIYFGNILVLQGSNDGEYLFGNLHRRENYLQKFVDDIHKRIAKPQTSEQFKLFLLSYLVGAGLELESKLFRRALEAAASGEFTTTTINILHERGFKDLATVGLLKYLRHFMHAVHSGGLPICPKQEDLCLLLECTQPEDIAIGGQYISYLYRIEDERDDELIQKYIRIYGIQSSRMFKVLQNWNPERAQILLENFIATYKNKTAEKAYKRLIWAAKSALKVFHNFPLAREIADDIYTSKQVLSPKELANLSVVYGLLREDQDLIRARECLGYAISGLQQDNLTALNCIVSACHLLDDKKSLLEAAKRTQIHLLKGLDQAFKDDAEKEEGRETKRKDPNLSPGQLFTLHNFIPILEAALFSDDPEILKSVAQHMNASSILTGHERLLLLSLESIILNLIKCTEQAEAAFSQYFEEIRLPGNTGTRQMVASFLKASPELLYTMKLPGYIYLLKHGENSAESCARKLLKKVHGEDSEDSKENSEGDE